MSDYDKCPICKEYGWLDRHRCAPEWEVMELDDHAYNRRPHDDDLPQPETVRARTAEGAAEKYCAMNDSADGEFNSSDRYIAVHTPATGEIQVCEVEAHLEPTYSGYIGALLPSSVKVMAIPARSMDRM